MSIQLLQEGRGSVRPVALLYLVGNQARAIAEALGPDVCVVSETVGNWNEETTPVAEALAKVGATGFAVGPLWLIGFSAGCQGVRAQINRGVKAQHVVACDGIHLPLGAAQPFQLVWKDVAARARLGYLTFSVSYSNTAATNFKTTKASAMELFGASGCFGSYADPCVEREGSLRIYGATNGGGAPADEHMDQLRKLMLRMVHDAKRDVGGGGSVWPVVVLAAATAALAWAFLGE